MKLFTSINGWPEKTAVLLAGIVSVFGALTVHAQPLIITTEAGYAGGGSANGTSSGALFFNAQGVAVDGAGNVYVADSGNNTIRMITAAGTSSTLAGVAGVSGSQDGMGSGALFNQPAGIALDSATNIYVSDSGNSTIRIVTLAGQVTTIAGQAGVTGSGNAVGTNAQFFHPLGLAVDSATNLYVADSGNHLVRKITPAHAVSTLAGSPGVFGFVNATGPNALFYQPEAVAVDPSGNVYVADTGNAMIRKITSGGAVSTYAGSAGTLGSTDAMGTNALFYQPDGIAIDGSGNLFVSDYFNNTVRQITTGTAVTTLAGLAGTAGSADGTTNSARFSAPQGVAVSGGIIYVADTANSTIRKVTYGGVVTTFAGSPSAGATNGTSLNARFYNPRNVAVDGSRNVYVADTQNSVIRKMSASGTVSILAGTPGVSGSVDGAGNTALFSSPQGIAVDGGGNVYVADTGNSTIRKITSGGTVATLAGSAGNPGNSDGSGTNAQFSAPQGVAVDSAGNIYVTDTWNHTIRKITPGGVSSTLAGLPGIFGTFDGTNAAARFNNPTGITVDLSGNLYVADTFNHTIRKITPAGATTTLAGLGGTYGNSDGTNTGALFYEPQGIALDSEENLYVVDSGNNTVRTVSPSGSNWVVTTLAGLAGVTGSTDGTGASARFYQPAGMAFDTQGTLLVADSGNNTLRFSSRPFFITDLGVVAGPHSAAITWNTTSNSTSQVAYGLTPAYGSFSSLSPYSAPATNHAVLLTGLLTNEVYYFQASSTLGSATLTTNGTFVTEGPSIVVISSQASFSGVWTIASAAPDRYTNDGGYYEFANTTNSSDTADAFFRPTIVTPANYDVYIWYSVGTNRSLNAPVTVGYNGGGTEDFINETVNGGSWQLLASGVPFVAGTNGFVRMGNGSGENNKIVIADAVEFNYNAAQDAPTDGTVPGWWANFFFGTNVVNSSLDLNGSGYNLYQDYVLGISPVDPTSHLIMNFDSIPGGGMQVSFFPYQTGRVYQLLSSTSIANPSWTNLNLPVTTDDNGNGFITITNNSTTQAFYRLSVQIVQ